MTKQNLIKIIVIVILAALLIGLILLWKEKENNDLERANNNDTPKIEENNKKTEPIEEEKLKIFAENFTTIYYSYSWGNFSNIESLKNSMTQRLWDEKSEWINNKKEILEGQPVIYAGVSNIPQKTDLVHIGQSKVKIEIECEQYKIEGASIYINGILTGVDTSGIESSVFPIYRKIENKKIRLELLREGNEWKVDKIE